jgi:hypothetical protein
VSVLSTTVRSRTNRVQAEAQRDEEERSAPHQRIEQPRRAAGMRPAGDVDQYLTEQFVRLPPIPPRLDDLRRQSRDGRCLNRLQKRTDGFADHLVIPKELARRAHLAERTHLRLGQLRVNLQQQVRLPRNCRRAQRRDRGADWAQPQLRRCQGGGQRRVLCASLRRDLCR